MKRQFYFPLALALMLVATSCKDKPKSAGSHTEDVQEEFVYPIDQKEQNTDKKTTETDDAQETESDDSRRVSGSAHSDNTQSEPKFTGVESSLRDFSEEPPSKKKDALMKVAALQDELQLIPFANKSDYKKAETLSRQISELFASIGAKDEAERWSQVADMYHKQAQ